MAYTRHHLGHQKNYPVHHADELSPIRNEEYVETPARPSMESFTLAATFSVAVVIMEFIPPTVF